MDPNPVRSRVVRKFVFFKEGDFDRGSRLQTSGRFNPSVANQKYFEECLKAAHHLLDHSPSNARLVFVGQAMRPIFETARAVNEFERKVNRRNLIYVLGAPKSREYKLFPLSPIEKAKAIELTKRRLEGKKGAKRPKGKAASDPYVVVDFRASGSTYGIVEEAIRQVHAKAHPRSRAWISLVDQKHPVCGNAIRFAEHHSRPTVKDASGSNLWGNPLASDREKQLVFQRMLRGHLAKHYPEFWELYR